MIYLYLFGTCFHFIYVFMIIEKKRKENAMNKEEALALVDVLLSEGTSPIEKERAAMQLRELIRILLPE